MIPRVIRRNCLTNQIRCFYQSSKLKTLNFQHSESDNTEHKSRECRDRELKSLLENSTAFIDTKPQNDLDKWSTSPYAEGTIISKRKGQELDIERPKIDPRDTSIILFPGDGAQFLGMAKSLDCVPAARDVFDYASEILKYDLLKLCNNGPKSQLYDIRYGHVAIMTACLANLELLREERPNAVYNCVGTAGFSLGEITALVFAGALQFDQALHLVQIRAEAIQAAADTYKGGMVQIQFGPDSRVVEACKKAKEWCIKNNIDQPECWISNFMYPRFKVLSGSEEALRYLEDNYAKFRLRSVKRIKNMPACHSALMEPTVEPMKQALEQMDISDPMIRVYSNVTCRPYYTARHIRKLLPQQLVKSVKWEQTMTYLYARRHGNYFPRTIVCGPGFNLRKILRKVNSKAWRQSIHIGDCP